jgi:MmyB-like transcription regulator ligand binding domain
MLVGVSASSGGTSTAPRRACWRRSPWPLQLDEVEHAHLFDLARTATNARSRPPARRVRPAVQRILDAMTGAPAWVRNARMDFLAANWLGDGRSHRERRAALTCRQQPDRDQQVVPRRGTVSSIR